MRKFGDPSGGPAGLYQRPLELPEVAIPKGLRQCTAGSLAGLANMLQAKKETETAKTKKLLFACCGGLFFGPFWGL